MGLRLTSASVLVVLAGDGGEHVEEERIDGTGHAGGENLGIGLDTEQVRWKPRLIR